MKRISFDLLPAKLNRYLAEHVFEVVEQRPIVYPNAALLKRRVDSINILEHIIRGVDEEASYDSIEFAF